MKERYNIEISDIQLSVVSDEPEDFVNSIVEKINARVSDLIIRNKRCSKLDAALLCALDYCGECTKAEKRIRNLEAQISLYEELASSQKASPAVKSALGIKDGADESADENAVTDTEDNAQSDETCTSCASCSADAECAPEDETKKAEEAKPAKENRAESKRDKLEQIEMLLRRNDDK